jgi:hypothetical protein
VTSQLGTGISKSLFYSVLRVLQVLQLSNLGNDNIIFGLAAKGIVKAGLDKYRCFGGRVGQKASTCRRIAVTEAVVLGTHSHPRRDFLSPITDGWYGMSSHSKKRLAVFLSPGKQPFFFTVECCRWDWTPEPTPI